MNSFFRLKRMTHVFINKFFYFLAFAFGFCLGGGTIEKITDIFNSLFNF